MSITDTIPGYVTGTWAIDPVHSDVSFSVRHLMVSKVRGRFGKFEGTIVTAENPLDSTVTATIDMSSVDTNDANRDAHLRSVDLFNVDQHPTMVFRSTRVSADGDRFDVLGDLTVHGVTHPITLKLEPNGFGTDPWGGVRAGFTGATEISRREFGIDFNIPMESGGVVVGDKISVTLEVEAVLQPAG